MSVGTLSKTNRPATVDDIVHSLVEVTGVSSDRFLVINARTDRKAGDCRDMLVFLHRRHTIKDVEAIAKTIGVDALEAARMLYRAMRAYDKDKDYRATVNAATDLIFKKTKISSIR